MPVRSLVPFANTLRRAMEAKSLTASDLARLVWGTAKDSRGYVVAKGRDRIGNYLAGTAYPAEKNRQKLADALGLPMDELAIEQRPFQPPRELRRPDIRPGMARIQIDCDGLQVTAEVSAETVRAVMGLIVAKTV